MSNTELLYKIDAAIAEKNLLKHPFYQDWQAGKLSSESLQLYAAQYYRHVEAFPKHLRVFAARTEGPLRDIVLENLAEEENPSLRTRNSGATLPPHSASARMTSLAAPLYPARRPSSKPSVKSLAIVL